MSEQTPDTESGMADSQDPSMEDILASIRKIIAEDDNQSSGAADMVIAEVVPDIADPVGDVSELGRAEKLDLDIISDEAPEFDTDIDALIGDMDAAVSDTLDPITTPVTSPVSESLDDVLDLEIPMDEDVALAEVEPPASAAEIDLVETETLTLEDELIDLVEEAEESVVNDEPKVNLMDGAMAALGLGGAAKITKTPEPEIEPKLEAEVMASEEDELSLMLDNMLEDSASYEEASRDFPEDRVVDPAADLISEAEAEDETGEDLLAELDFVEDAPEAPEVISDADPDIDLVKSLMADLTEEPLHDEDELAEAEAEAPVLENDDEVDTSMDDIMDEILSVTIDDEAKLSEELAIPEISAPTAEQAASESLSLKEIAAAAEADAVASESGVSSSLGTGLSAAVIGGVAAVAAQNEASDIEELEESNEDADFGLSDLEDLLADDDAAEQDDLTVDPITPEPTTPESIIEETPEMARAKKTDAIIDEVTETATAGAFASLTSVVEEKATVAERGDRIGDLVMEALQPMLKEWLDANLKSIVERAVTKEVKRISSGK